MKNLVLLALVVIAFCATSVGFFQFLTGQPVAGISLFWIALAAAFTAVILWVFSEFCSRKSRQNYDPPGEYARRPCARPRSSSPRSESPPGSGDHLPRLPRSRGAPRLAPPSNEAVPEEFRKELRKLRVPAQNAETLLRIASLRALCDVRSHIDKELPGRLDSHELTLQVCFARELRSRYPASFVRGASAHRAMTSALIEWRRSGDQPSGRILVESKFIEHFSFDERLSWRLASLGIDSASIALLLDRSRQDVERDLREVQATLGELVKRVARSHPETKAVLEKSLDAALVEAFAEWLKALVSQQLMEEA